MNKIVIKGNKVELTNYFGDVYRGEFYLKDGKYYLKSADSSLALAELVRHKEEIEKKVKEEKDGLHE